MDAETKATIHIQREVDDTDTVNYSIADFIQAAKVGGSKCVFVYIYESNKLHSLYSPSNGHYTKHRKS